MVEETNSSKPKRAEQSSNSHKVLGEQQSPVVNADQESAALVSVLNWNAAAWTATVEDGPIACSSELVLADSGATHVIKCVDGGTPPPSSAKNINLKLAVGTARAKLDNEGTVWISSQSGAELVPLGKFINECDLQLDWSRAGAHVTTREGRVIELLLKNGLPYFRKKEMWSTCRS